MKSNIVQVLQNDISIFTTMKSQIGVEAYYKTKDGDEPYYHNSAYEQILNTSQIPRFIDSAFASLVNKQSEFEGRGSGLSTVGVSRIIIKSYKYKPLTGSSFVKLPDWVANKKGCINIKNEDNKCFLWSVLAALHPAAKDAERVTKYKPYESEIKISEYPVKLSDISKIEKDNLIIVTGKLAPIPQIPPLLS